MMNIKKKIMVIFATGIMAFSASPFVLAATPAPANNTQQAEQVDTTKQDTANQNNTANQNIRYARNSWYLLSQRTVVSIVDREGVWKSVSM